MPQKKDVRPGADQKRSRGVKQRSKVAYVRHRKARVRELYENDGLQPRDIAARLVDEGTIETGDESLASAVRVVQRDVKEIREEIDAFRASDASPRVTGTEIDALERQLTRLRKNHARQELIADGEPTEMCARSRYPIGTCTTPDCALLGHVPFVGAAIGVTITDTPQGPMTSYRALWPAGVRQKASKDASIIAEKIARLEVVLVEKRQAISEMAMKSRTDSSGAAGDGVFRVVTSGKTMDELIASNAGVGETPN